MDAERADSGPSIARQRSEIASEPSIGPCLRPPFKEISTFSSHDKIYPSVVLQIRDVGCHELLGQLSLIPEVCPIQILSKSDAPILSTSHVKTRVATNMFASKGRPYFPAPLLLSERKTALRVIAFNTVRQHAILLPGAQFGARRRLRS